MKTLPLLNAQRANALGAFVVSCALAFLYSEIQSTTAGIDPVGREVLCLAIEYESPKLAPDDRHEYRKALIYIDRQSKLVATSKDWMSIESIKLDLGSLRNEGNPKC